MKLDTYQGVINDFARYPAVHAKRYCALGLFGEAGEIGNQVKKIWRDDDGVLTEDRKAKLRDELGDVLWYAVRFAHEHEIVVGTLTLELGAGVEELGLKPPTDIFSATENLAVLAATAIISNLLDDDRREDFHSDFATALLSTIADVADILDTNLEDLAQANVDKLTGRVERGTLGGSGDGR